MAFCNWFFMTGFHDRLFHQNAFDHRPRMKAFHE